jgi:hypothetical protein
MEDISEIEFGIGPEKLFPANDRFCKLPNLPIPTGIDEEKRLLEISRNSRLLKSAMLLGNFPDIELFDKESFTSLERLEKTLKSESAERPKLSRTTPATLPPLQRTPFHEDGHPSKSMDSSFHEFST